MSNFDTVFSTAPKWTNVEAIDATDVINSAYKNAELQNKAFDKLASAGNQVFDIAQKQQAIEIQKAIDALSTNELANTAKAQADIGKLIKTKFSDLGGASVQTQADIYKSLSNAYPERLKQEDAKTALQTNQLNFKQKEREDAYGQHGETAVKNFMAIGQTQTYLQNLTNKLNDSTLTDEQKEAINQEITKQTAVLNIYGSALEQSIANMGEHGADFRSGIDGHVENYKQAELKKKQEEEKHILTYYKDYATHKAYSMYGSFAQAMVMEDKAKQQQVVANLLTQIEDLPKLAQDMVIGNVYKILQDEGRHEQAVQLDKLKLKIEQDRLAEQKRQFGITAGFEAQKVANDTAKTEAEIANLSSQIDHRDSGGDGSGGDAKGKGGRPAYMFKDPNTKKWVINEPQLAQEFNNKVVNILSGVDAYQALFKTNDGGTLSVADFHKQNKEKLNEGQQRLYEDLKTELAKPKHKLDAKTQLHALHTFTADLGSVVHEKQWWNDLTLNAIGEPEFGYDYLHKERLANVYIAKSKNQLKEHKVQQLNSLLNEYIDTFTNYKYDPKSIQAILSQGGINDKLLWQLAPFMTNNQKAYFSPAKIQANSNSNKDKQTNSKAAKVDKALKEFNSTNGKL